MVDLNDEKVVKKLKKITLQQKRLPLYRGVDFSDSIRREYVQEDIFSCGIVFYLFDERF